MSAATMTEPMHCACGNYWRASLRPAEPGDCRQSGAMLVAEEGASCPECGLVNRRHAYCHECDEELTPARVYEIARSAERPDLLQDCDFLCSAHALDPAGCDVEPREHVGCAAEDYEVEVAL